jgi:hypothetical protein
MPLGSESPDALDHRHVQMSGASTATSADSDQTLRGSVGEDDVLSHGTLTLNLDVHRHVQRERLRTLLDDANLASSSGSSHDFFPPVILWLMRVPDNQKLTRTSGEKKPTLILMCS